MIVPDDVRLAAREVSAILTEQLDADWSVSAGGLEWSVEETAAHMAGAVAKYALYLARRSTRFMAVAVRPWSTASRGERVEAIQGVAEVLANVAEVSPPGARGYHAAGMLTAEGFCGLACVELLVHGHDVAEGLGVGFAPAGSLVERLVGRVFPWLASEGGDTWELMLWHTGRVQLPGRASHSDDRWGAVLVPLSEWDGAIPQPHPRPVVEWVREESGRWSPVYREAE